MTATFGKLEHQTLTLAPGLNIIEAPNEWGKSTWCAFLINMLYGIDTRARSSSAGLPDKERYAPWSGAAMSGRIDLNWNGKDITIERTSNARTPMGIFKAYETESGLDIPELNSANCGQMLLGVERNVFSKAGFLRLADLPVIQDDALRRRLNNLVTTGDESDTADKLAQTLKDLKNKCRSNRANGLIPEAEEQRDSLRKQLYDMQDLGERTQQIQDRQKELEEQLHALEVHQQALDYADAQQDAQKVKDAEDLAENARKHRDELMQATQNLPSAEAARTDLIVADRLQEAQMALFAEQQTLPQRPEPVATGYEGSVETAKADLQALQALEAGQKKNRRLIPIFIGCAIAVLAAVAVCRFVLQLTSLLIPAVGVGLVFAGLIAVITLRINHSKKFRTQQAELLARHSGQRPDSWVSNAEAYGREQAAYAQQLEAYQQVQDNFTQKQNDLNARLQDFASDKSLSQRRADAEEALRIWNALAEAEKEADRTTKNADILRSMAKVVEQPQEPDTLLYSALQTKDLLTSARFEQRQLQIKLAQCEGQMVTQGQEPAIRAQIDALNQRIARLEEHYSAIELAQLALQKASAALQRRFAPRISQRAQELFSKLTDGRYHRITMAADLSLSTAAENEDTLRDAQRRSDGTIDQLYLALRLAVAEELTPDAPLILDDALVRFDDKRLALAMNILKEEAETKQVILFTCQSREQNA